MLRKFFMLLIIQLCCSSRVCSYCFECGEYKYQIAACLMFQNDSFFLKEWIEYHRMIGVQHFYLFNNGSTDNYLEILDPYLQSGVVELFHYPFIGYNQEEHNKIQSWIYCNGIASAYGETKWLAIIDTDEFIVPMGSEPLINILNRYENYGGLYINYLMFGTSHVKNIPPGKLIIETLTHCAEAPQAFGKSIVRPERVSGCSDPHRMWYHSPYVHVDTKFRTFDWTPPGIADDVLLLHHYYLGDENHAIQVKYPRRKKWNDVGIDTFLQGNEWMNAKENTFMQRFVPNLRKRMKLSKRG